jgi:hypothetical protein
MLKILNKDFNLRFEPDELWILFTSMAGLIRLRVSGLLTIKAQGLIYSALYLYLNTHY